jgi:hypothetical protein
VCREFSCREVTHEVKHTAAFHASPSHHHFKLNLLLRASFKNVLRSYFCYSLVARLSAVMRLQGKAEECWISERNHPPLSDFKGCHLRRLLIIHWRITKISINPSCKYSTRSIAFSCLDLGLNRVLRTFPIRIWSSKW